MPYWLKFLTSTYHTASFQLAKQDGNGKQNACGVIGRSYAIAKLRPVMGNVASFQLAVQDDNNKYHHKLLASLLQLITIMYTPDDGSAQSATWPMPKFRFEVDFGTVLKGVVFQEVSGLDVEHQIIEYRKSDSFLFSTEKMPGLMKYGNVTLKRGVFSNNNTFWNWHSQISKNTIARIIVVIKLLDENGNIAMQWHLKNAWLTKITSTDIKSDANQVAVDTIEIAHEQLVIINGE